MGRIDYESETLIPTGGGFDVTHALRGEGFDASEDGTGRGTPIVPVAGAICRDSFSGGASGRPEGAAAGHFVPVAIQERAVSENPDNGPQGAGFRQDGAAYTLEARNKVQAVAFDCKGTEVQFSTDGAHSTLRSMGHSNSHQNAGGHAAVAFDLRGREGGAMPEGPHDTANIRAASGGSSRSYIAQPWAVRRLTPTECERLQGFPPVEKCITINVWSDDRLQRDVDVAAPCTIGQSNACNVDESALQLSADRAASPSSTVRPDHALPVALYVLIDCERGEVRIRNHERLLWSASAAEKPKPFPLPIEIDSFVHLVALLMRDAERRTPLGKAASPQVTAPFMPLGSGNWYASVSGDEIADTVNVAAFVTSLQSRSTTSTILLPTLSSPTAGPTMETLCCYAVAAIGSFIPEQTPPGSSFAVRIETTDGFTNVPFGNRRAADGPRYKALGNSMAVNVMRWIGQRIDEVDRIK